MTKAETLFNFFAGFNIPAYEESAIYGLKQAPTFPYLTYEYREDGYGTDVPLTFSLWYHDYSYNNAYAKSAEISAEIGRGGKVLPCDGGYVLIQRGHPFAIFMSDDSDDLIKRISHNITVRYYTND